MDRRCQREVELAWNGSPYWGSPSPRPVAGPHLRRPSPVCVHWGKPWPVCPLVQALTYVCPLGQALTCVSPLVQALTYVCPLGQALTCVCPLVQALTYVCPLGQALTCVCPLVQTLTCVCPLSQALTCVSPLVQALTYVCPLGQALTYVCPLVQTLTYVCPLGQALTCVCPLVQALTYVCPLGQALTCVSTRTIPHLCVSTGSSPHLCVSTGSSPHLCVATGSSPHLCVPTGSSPHLCVSTGSGPHLYVSTGSSPHLCVPTGSSPHLCVSTGSSPHLCVATGSGPHLCVSIGSSPHLCVSTGSSPHLCVSTGEVCVQWLGAQWLWAQWVCIYWIPAGVDRPELRTSHDISLKETSIAPTSRSVPDLSSGMSERPFRALQELPLLTLCGQSLLSCLIRAVLLRSTACRDVLVSKVLLTSGQIKWLPREGDRTPTSVPRLPVRPGQAGLSLSPALPYLLSGLTPCSPTFSMSLTMWTTVRRRLWPWHLYWYLSHGWNINEVNRNFIFRFSRFDWKEMCFIPTEGCTYLSHSRVNGVWLTNGNPDSSYEVTSYDSIKCVKTNPAWPLRHVVNRRQLSGTVSVDVMVWVSGSGGQRQEEDKGRGSLLQIEYTW